MQKNKKKIVWVSLYIETDHLDRMVIKL